MKNVNSKRIPIIAIFVGVIIVGILLFKTSNSGIENDAVPLVTQILQEQFEIDRECEDVTITKDNKDNTYDAKATLDNGSAINILVEYYPDKKRIFVQIPYSEVLLLN